MTNVITVTVDEPKGIAVSTCRCGWSSRAHYASTDDGLFEAHVVASREGSEHAEATGHRVAWGE